MLEDRVYRLEHPHQVRVEHLEPAAPSQSPERRRWTFVAAGVVAAVLVLVGVSVFVATRDDGALDDADVMKFIEQRPLFGSRGEQFPPGTYAVTEVDGTKTPGIVVTLGAGWVNTVDGWGIGQRGVGYITFSRPDKVFLDACHPSDGYYAGPLTTLDGLLTALREQEGWAEVSEPADIAVESAGREAYVGKTFRRTVPADIADCTMTVPPSGVNVYPRFPSWENDSGSETGWSYYSAGEVETLWIIDVGTTVIIVNTRLLAGQPEVAHDAFAAVLNSVRIGPT